MEPKQERCISAWVPEELVERIEQTCRREDRSRSAVIRRALERYVTPGRHVTPERAVEVSRDRVVG